MVPGLKKDVIRYRVSTVESQQPQFFKMLVDNGSDGFTQRWAGVIGKAAASRFVLIAKVKSGRGDWCALFGVGFVRRF